MDLGRIAAEKRLFSCVFYERATLFILVQKVLSRRARLGQKPTLSAMPSSIQKSPTHHPKLDPVSPVIPDLIRNLPHPVIPDLIRDPVKTNQCTLFFRYTTNLILSFASPNKQNRLLLSKRSKTVLFFDKRTRRMT